MLDGVIAPVVCRCIGHGKQGLHRRLGREEAQAASGFGLDTGVAIGGRRNEHLFGLGDFIAVIGQDPNGRCAGFGSFGRCEDFGQEIQVDPMVRLLNPQCFAAVSVVVGRRGIFAGQPSWDRSHDFGFWSVSQFASDSVAGSPFVLAELFEQFRNGLAVLGRGLDQGSFGVDQPIESTSNVVAIRIALAVLHVSDQGVGPVAEPQRAVGSDLRIRRSEVFIARADQIVG